MGMSTLFVILIRNTDTVYIFFTKPEGIIINVFTLHSILPSTFQCRLAVETLLVYYLCVIQTHVLGGEFEAFNVVMHLLKAH